MRLRTSMRFLTRLALSAGLLLAVPVPAISAQAIAFRLFLLDGTPLVSYGEYVRLDDRVVFSTPIGGSEDDPRLHVVTLPAALVDWPRTDRYAESARARHYAVTRGEEDFQRLTDEVARVLSEIALSTDRSRALAIATSARAMLANWPGARYGYREAEVRDVIMLLDHAIGSLSGAPPGTFELSFVATAPSIELDPAGGLPTHREQLDQALRVASLVDRAADRVAILEAALKLLDEQPGVWGSAGTAALRRSIESRLGAERAIDARYAQLSGRLLQAASRAAARARVADVEQILDRVSREDARLGRRRPETVQALHASLLAHLDAARRLRLLLDRWNIRKSLYRAYERDIGPELARLARARPGLEAIRRLEGPMPDRLVELRTDLSGGSVRLDRVAVPGDLQAAHDLLVGAWRFAERAVAARFEAAATGSLSTAWDASSAAAAALMLIARAEQQIRELLEPPAIP